MKWSTIKLGLLVLLMIVFLSGTLVWGQLGTSTIRGTITDPSGAAVPGATVTITNLQTNLSRTLTTGPTGSYSFELIPPGEYQVVMEAKGFRKSVVAQVRALVGSITEVSQSLTVGEVKETVVVEVSSSDIHVNTQDATLGNNIESQQILGLPLNDRNVLALLTLQPG
ncbi:MAG TPA: carboxypeptidase-like regulatory domain-containing protein, partial [Candidatus Angelobacter sp.]